MIGASAPNAVKPEWIRSMAPRSIVFACANPVPEIYPYAAKEAEEMQKAMPDVLTDFSF